MWMTGHVVNVCVYLYLLGDEKEGRKKEKEEEKVIIDNIP